MPSRSQLETETVWTAETVPPAITTLGNKVRDHYHLSPAAIGSKGDENHDYGYHRSAAWIRSSRWCTNRSYSVSETPGNRRPGSVNWVCALDLSLGPHMVEVCKRLDTAVRAGRLEKITEWYGNDNGDQRVDGYDNIHNQLASSDDSHLWHLHLSFDRGHANEDHSDVLAILTGDDMPLTDADVAKIWNSDRIPAPKPPYADADVARNPTWQADNTLAELVRQGRENEALLRALTTAVTDLAKAVTQPPAA